jgi:hypothetical protein
LSKTVSSQINETQQTPSIRDVKKTTERQVIVPLFKSVMTTSSSSQRRKCVQRNKERMATDFSMGAMQAGIVSKKLRALNKRETFSSENISQRLFQMSKSCKVITTNRFTTLQGN